MSAAGLNNGKKSSCSSTVNTPASTPIATLNGNQPNQASPPPNNNAPKYGTLVPNRIFVGGISANTTESELMQLFSSYGAVKAAKIIQDRAGVSKGYGFITFESEDDAQKPLREAENIVLRERRLNIAPAIKKQPFSRPFDASSPPTVAAGNPPYFFPPGAPVPYFQGGVAYYSQPAPAPGDPATQQPAVYQPPAVYPAQTGPQQTATYPPMMFPAQTIYMPQQYPMPMPYEYNYYQNNGGGPQYMVGNGQGPQCAPMQPSSSPPRPHCYNQQLPYNPNDAALFYNMSLYGSGLEPMYSDGIELQPQYSEDAPPPPTSSSSFTIEQSNQPQQPQLQTEIDHIYTPQHHHQHHHHHQQQQQQPPHQDQSDKEETARNSNTPVVSFHAIEQQQEKDFSSLQGGRRRKSLPQQQQQQPQPHPPFQQNQFQHPNGFHPLGVPLNVFNAPPMYTPFNPPIPHDFYTPRLGSKPLNGFDKMKKRRINNNNNNNNNCKNDSSRSSLRTDSNSSASVVDEANSNCKGEGVVVTEVNTPPLAPYSPLANAQQLKRSSGNGVYTQQSQKLRANDRRNNNLGGGGGSAPKAYQNHHNQRKEMHVYVSPQVHAATQSFAAPRRSRRSLRRGGGGGSVSEIGAGDAPLPEAVSDVCKKVEGLKL